MAGVYFSPTSVISFYRGFSCCPYYRGVRYGGVSARRELTELRKNCNQYCWERIMGQRGNIRASARMCELHSSYI